MRSCEKISDDSKKPTTRSTSILQEWKQDYPTSMPMRSWRHKRIYRKWRSARGTETATGNEHLDTAIIWFGKEDQEYPAEQRTTKTHADEMKWLPSSNIKPYRWQTRRQHTQTRCTQMITQRHLDAKSFKMHELILDKFFSKYKKYHNNLMHCTSDAKSYKKFLK